MTDFRVVRFTNPQDFLDVVQPHDDSFMNFTLGSVLDSMDPAQIKIHKLTDASRTLLAIYRGNRVIATFTKIATDFAWVISVPREHEDNLPTEDVPAVISLLVSHLPSVIDPKSFDALFGPQHLVDAFIDAWASEMNATRLHIEALPPAFCSKVTYATLATIPAPSPALAKFQIGLATLADVDILTDFYIDFYTVISHVVTLDEARDTMTKSVQLGQIWVCRDEGELAGYCAVARMTPRTSSIRNVYVSPKHRRKGVAEAMTRALTRYYLGAEPRGFEGGPEGSPPHGVKDEISLNVAEEHVERLYKKCGFLLGEDAIDPVTGKQGWFPSSCRGVRILDV